MPVANHNDDCGSKPPTSTSTSPSLLARVKADDAAAWDRLVTLYAPLVYGWCRRFELQAEDMADVFQDVFQAVAVHISGFHKQKRGDTFRGWLRIITRNKVHDHFRRVGREPAGVGGTDAQQRFAQVPAAAPQDDDSEPDRKEDRRLFQRGLDQIRDEFEERTWQAFWRTAVEGRPHQDVAEELSMSVGAVRVAKCRVLQRLRDELGDMA